MADGNGRGVACCFVKDDEHVCQESQKSPFYRGCTDHRIKCPICQQQVCKYHGASNNSGAKGGHSDCVHKDTAGQKVIDAATGKDVEGECAIKGGPLATALCTGYMSHCKRCDAFYCSRHAGRENGGGLDIHKGFTLSRPKPGWREGSRKDLVGPTGHECKPVITEEMRLKSPSLNQVPPEWLEDPALVKILESASFHEERKRFEEKLQQHSVSAMVLLGLAGTIRGYVMLDSWFKDWKVKHHTPPTWWNKQWTSDPRPKAAHPLFQMKDLDVGSQNGQAWKLEKLWFWQYKLMLFLERPQIQAGLLMLLIVDTLLFAGENYAKSKFIESILDGAKLVCHSAPPAAGECGGTDFPVSSAFPRGLLLPDAAWNEMGDSSWQDVELACRWLSFATLTLFLVFEFLAIFSQGRYFAIDGNWRGPMNVIGLGLVLLPWFGYLGELSNEAHNVATKSFGSNWAIIFIVARAARNLHGSTRESSAKEAIQKEKERSVKLVAQEKGWLMDKACNYHEAFMSVENHARSTNADEDPPIIGLTWSPAEVTDALNFSKQPAAFIAEFRTAVLAVIDNMTAATVTANNTAMDCTGTLSTWSFLPGTRLTPSEVHALAVTVEATPITVVVNGVAYTTVDPVISDRDDLPKTISAVELALVMKSLQHEEINIVIRFITFIRANIFGVKTASVATADELLKAKRAIALFTRDKHNPGNGTMDFEEFVSMMLCRSDTTRKQEQEEAFRLLCGGETFDGDYTALNRFKRGRPAVHRVGDIVARWKVPPKRRNTTELGTWGYWEVDGEDRLLPDLDAVQYGQFAVEYLSEKPPKVKPKYTDATLPSYLHKRKTHFFQYYDSMLKERLSHLDSDKDNYVQFKELTHVLDDAHRGRWGIDLSFADVKALAATLKHAPISVTVCGAVYSTGGTAESDTDTPAPAPTVAPSTPGSGSLPFIDLTWILTSDSHATPLDFGTASDDFIAEFGTAALAAINSVAHGSHSQSTMWRYIYTMTDENTAMDFNGRVLTCTFLEGTGLADCYSWPAKPIFKPNMNRFSTPIDELDAQDMVPRAPRNSVVTAMVGLTVPGLTVGPARSASEQVPTSDKRSTVWLRSSTDRGGGDGEKVGMPGGGRRRESEPAYGTAKLDYWC